MQQLINHTNYEAYFISYADGELSPAERSAVDEFCRQEDGMQTILQSYIDARLIPEHIEFTNKLELTKLFGEETEALLIGALHGEADTDTITWLEAERLQEPTIDKEWALLQQTIMQPEPIVFSDKHLLYKKEEQTPGLIFWLGRLALAAAIALICFGIFKIATSKQETEFVKGPDVQKTPAGILPKKPNSLPAKDTLLQQNLAVQNFTTTKPKKEKEVAIRKKEVAIQNDYIAVTAPAPKTVRTEPAKVTAIAFQNNSGNTPLAIKQPGTLTKLQNDAADNTYKSDEELSNTYVFYINTEKLENTAVGSLYKKLKKKISAGENLKNGSLGQIKQSFLNP